MAHLPKMSRLQKCPWQIALYELNPAGFINSCFFPCLSSSVGGKAYYFLLLFIQLLHNTRKLPLTVRFISLTNNKQVLMFHARGLPQSF